MGRPKKIVKEETVVEDVPSQDTLHPNSGSGAGAEPSHFDKLQSIMGALAYKGTVEKFYNAMMKDSAVWTKGAGVPDGAASTNQGSIHTYASDAVGKSPNGKFVPDNAVCKDGEDGKSDKKAKRFIPDNAVTKEAVSASVNELLSEVELPDDLKTKAQVLFEAAVQAHVNTIIAQLEEQFETQLAEQLDEAVEGLEEKVANYCEYVATEWMTENEVAIESALRSEITAEFMSKLRDLFNESNINIPEEQVEVVDALATKNDELEARLAEAIEVNAALLARVEASDRQAVVAEMSEGMTLADSQRFKKLAEAVDADTVEDFKTKAVIIKESIGKPAKKESTVDAMLTETNEDNKKATGNEEKTFVSPEMRSYVASLDRTSARS